MGFILFLIVIRCQIERTILFKNTEDVNIQVFSLATNFECGERPASGYKKKTAFESPKS
jgi:hypothetical protein